MYKIQPIRVAYQKPGNLKFFAPFRINIQKRNGKDFTFEKPVFDFSELKPKKSGLSKKLKVSTTSLIKHQLPRCKSLKGGSQKITTKIPLSLHYHHVMMLKHQDKSFLFQQFILSIIIIYYYCTEKLREFCFTKGFQDQLCLQN